MRRRALRPPGLAPGVFPPREAVPKDRDSLRDALRPGELLLALHLRLGAREHDPRVRGDSGVPTLPEPPFSHPQREHGPDNNVSRVRSR